MIQKMEWVGSKERLVVQKDIMKTSFTVMITKVSSVLRFIIRSVNTEGVR